MINQNEYSQQMIYSIISLKQETKINKRPHAFKHTSGKMVKQYFLLLIFQPRLQIFIQLLLHNLLTHNTFTH